jgi:hypothetical protein
VPEIIKRKKETNVTPVEKAKNDEGGHKEREFQDTPESLPGILAFQFLENRLGIFSEETEESIFEGMLRGSIMTMFVNRDPVHRLSIFIGQVRVAFVMLHVDAFIKDLAEADRDRLQDAKQSIQQGRAKIGIVNEIVRNTVDVPGDADRVNKTEGQHSPKWETREKVKHPEEVGAVENPGQYWNGIPSGVRKDFGVSLHPTYY